LRKGECWLIIDFASGVAAMRVLAGIYGWLLGAALLAGPVAAHPTSPELADRFARGEYMEAARQAEQAGGADDLAFAARSLLALCFTGAGEPDASVIGRARSDAEAALRIDPAHGEGRLQLAIALSLQSRSMDVMTAWNGGYGEKGRKLANEVLKADPGNYYAHGFLAIWNVEVRRRGGALGAVFMGASLKDARKHYEEAMRLAPDDAGIHWQYGRALAALDIRAHGTEAVRALERSVAANADSHVERVMQARAVELLRVLQGDRKQAQRLAQQLL
jgi:tetratricopeptide (TPR) repeat protein